MIFSMMYDVHSANPPIQKGSGIEIFEKSQRDSKKKGFKYFMQKM